MKKTLADYLNTMERKISSKKHRLQAREEILNHFFDQIDSLMEQGKSWQESIDQVLRDATPPKELGKKLNLAHRPFYLRYPLTLFFSVTSMASVVALIFIANYAMEQSQETIKENLNQRKFYTDFFKDLEDLKQFNLYKVSRKKNVHNYLAKHMDIFNYKSSTHLSLSSGSVCEEYKLKYSKVKCPELDNKLKYQLQKSILDKKSMKLNWLDEITNYDHWNFHSDPLVKNHLMSVNEKSVFAKIDATSSYKFPAMSELKELILVRAHSLIQQEQKHKAEILLDKTFNIFISTNTLSGASFAARILKEKNTFIQEYKLKEWTKIPEDYTKIYARVHFAWPTVLNDYTNSEKFHEKLEPYMDAQYGVCTGLSESAVGFKMKQDFFKSPNYFEPNYHLSLSKLEKHYLGLVAICDMPEFLPILSQNNREPLFSYDHQVFANDDNILLALLNVIPVSPTKIPFVRTILGSFLNAFAIPNFNQHYKSEKWQRKDSVFSKKESKST